MSSRVHQSFRIQTIVLYLYFHIYIINDNLNMTVNTSTLISNGRKLFRSYLYTRPQYTLTHSLQFTEKNSFPSQKKATKYVLTSNFIKITVFSFDVIILIQINFNYGQQPAYVAAVISIYGGFFPLFCFQI